MQHLRDWILGQMAGNVQRKADNAITCKDKAMLAIYRCQLLSKTDMDVESLAIEVKKAFMQCKLLKRCYEVNNGKER